MEPKTEIKEAVNIINLPSGKEVVVEKFTGAHVKKAQADIAKGSEASADLEEGLLWTLISLTCKIDGHHPTMKQLEDMPGKDLLVLMGEFSGALTQDVSTKELPVAEPGKTNQWLPSGKLCTIEEFKGRHIKEAQRQAQGKKDQSSSSFTWILISRMATIDGMDIFPEDIDAMDGQDVLAIMGAFAAASFS